MANANAKVAYGEYQNIFNSKEWKVLEAEGARTQRLLWASTSTKNPAYHKLLYVNELIGPNTINTVPPATYDLILTEAEVKTTLTTGIEEAQLHLAELKNFGIDYDKITNQLLMDGVESFSKSFDSLMRSLSEKSKKFKKKTSLSIGPANFKKTTELTISALKSDNVVKRIWQNDYTLWKNNPTEITNRLGWLKSPDYMLAAIPDIEVFVDEVRREGFTHALLMGMGGSSLAPEVFRFVFGVKDGYLDLSVLDSTDAAAVWKYENSLDFNKTLFIVSTKSGGTIETLSFAKYYYNKLLQKFGKLKAGHHFVAITDEGSKLEGLAKQLNFRKIFFNDPNVGGRFSALTHFGLVPAALIGLDLNKLLNRTQLMKNQCQFEDESNSAAFLGALLGESALLGRDKITFLVSPQISSFVSWVEQLIAESTGKEGKGILPVEIETTENPEFFGKDRIFVYIKLGEDTTFNAFSEELLGTGYPLIEIKVEDPYDLGKEYFRWEFATAVAGWRLKINPFDQPNVEVAKVAARQTVAAFQKEGKLPELDLLIEENGVKVFSDVRAENLQSALNNFLSSGESTSEKEKSYIAIQAYLQPTDAVNNMLKELRKKLLEKCGLAITIGYGPRFLHSTGQLHKGDSGKGLFIQIISQEDKDLPIPDNPGEEKSIITFNILKNAQSLGDRQALLDAGRNVLRLEIDHPVNGLEKILQSLD
jgi:glucose-6-phosphate isomerase